MVLHLLVATTVAGVPVALPGCPEACGSVTVPYPFGFRQGCFHAGFNLTCDVTHHPPKLLLGDGVEVDAISLADNTVRVRSKVLNYEYNTSLEYGGSWSGGLAATGTIVVSTQHNVFVAVGCGLIAHLVPIHGDGDDRAPRYVVSACAALCDGIPDPSDTSCSGVGCCQTTIVQGLPTYGVQLKDLDQTLYVNQRSMWWTAFIVDREWFVRNIGAMRSNTFDDRPNRSDPYQQHAYASSKVTSVPTVLEWWLDLERDYDLVVFDPNSGWRCVSSNSFGVAAGGAKCHCSEGYQGNPHILHGCQGIYQYCYRLPSVLSASTI